METLSRILFALAALLCTAPAVADILPQTYPFSSAASVPLEDMSSGTTTLVAANLDDNASAVANIGFDFYFDGVRQTQFSVNANGLLRFGSTVVTTSFDNASTTTGFASATNSPKLAPYYDDLWIGTNGRVHARVVGTAPNRKLIVEWQNMQIPRVGPGNVGAGTFQAWLFERTGVIQFVYGNGVVLNSIHAGYTIGIADVPPEFASVTTAGNSVNYFVANNTQTNAVAPGTSYIFTPPAPTPPIGLNFTGVTAVGMTLNWTDSPNESLYLVEQSTDGTNYTYFANRAAGTTSLPVTDLSPNTTYFWRVYSVSSGALSAVISGSQATLPAGNISSTGTGGPWSATTTWVGGVVPTAGDIVTIAGGAEVFIDTTALAVSLNVSGILVFDANLPRTLEVGGDVSIGAAGIVRTAATGPIFTHGFNVRGNLVNAGTLDLSTADTAGATLVFTGSANATWSGSGRNDVMRVVMNKGTSSAPTLELTAANFTHLGMTTANAAGWLDLFNGTFKLSGAFTVTNRTFISATYIIPATAGFWLNNPNYTVVGQAGGINTVNNGLLRVTQGIFNIGVGAADGMGGGAGAMFIVEGGTVNASGRIDPQNSASYTQTAGTVNVAVVGNSRSGNGSFELRSAGSTFNMSGGVINVINPNPGPLRVDFLVRATTFNITGGQVIFGAAGAPAASTYVHVGGLVPTFTINPTMTLNINNDALFMRGASVTNNGAIISTGANARFDFAGLVPMSYSGTGTFGTAVTPFAGSLGANSQSLTTLNSPIVVTRVNLFTGGFINSNRIHLGNGGASSTTVQIGVAGLLTAGGSFDVSPNHQQGTGGQTVLYEFETAPRTTSFEINPTRMLTSLTVDNPNHVTLAGGDLTLTGPAVAATLTNGRLITGASTLIMSSATATVTRTNGFVDGNLRKVFAAAANKTFEVGSANGFSPVAFNVTAGTFPASVTAAAIQGPGPLIAPINRALARHWSLTAANITADLTFTYRDPADLPAGISEALLNVYRRDAGVWVNQGGTTNAVANTANIVGVTTFSLWTLAEPGAGTGNSPTIAAAGVTRRAGDAVSNSTIANVSDVEDAENTLTVTVNGGATATLNNVTVDTISTSAGGVVTANVVAACGATNTPFTLRVTDSSALFTESILNVTVLANLAPTLSYPVGTSVASGGSTTANPATGPTDSGAITGIVVSNPGTYTGGVSVNSGGVVSLTAASPVGSHALVIRASDNCNAATDANLVLNVGQANTTTTIQTDSPDPSVAGQAVTVTYTVVAQAPGFGTPTGNVMVSDGVNNCTGTVAAGQCVVTLTTQGNRTLTATYDGVADPNFNGSSDTELHQVNPPATDLQITKSANATQIQSGVIQYTVIATNAGPLAVTGATVVDNFPGSVTSVTYTCSGTGGGTCVNGGGNINQTVNLPVGATVTFAITGMVATSPPPDSIVNVATVASIPAIPDSNTANNSATVTTTIVLFRNGFEGSAGVPSVVERFGDNIADGTIPEDTATEIQNRTGAMRGTSDPARSNNSVVVTTRIGIGEGIAVPFLSSALAGLLALLLACIGAHAMTRR